MFGLLHTHRLVLRSCPEAGGGVESFVFTPEQPFEAKAGQHGILQLGGTVTFRGPVSKFTLDGAAPQVVMLAQGVGITPLRSMLAHAALSGMTIESSLIHVARVGHAYRAETEQWATTAAYPRHADDFRAAARPEVAGHRSPVRAAAAP